MSKGFLPLLFTFFTLSAAHSFLNSNEVTENEVQQSLMDNLETDVEQGQKWSEIHQALLPTYNALPKNSQGLIDHQAVRYVLHRMFVQKYGWYIKGLEPSGDHWHEEKPSDTELAKELVSHEAKNRLKTAYQIHDFPMTGELTRDQADDLVRTWYVSFLLAGNFSASSPDEVHSKKAIFARRAQRVAGCTQRARSAPTEEDWQDADDWLVKLEKEHYEGNLALQLGKKAGRVRLSTFYKKSLYSHWRFTEKACEAEYLRRLGALDDSDVQQPQVIMANYMMAGKLIGAAWESCVGCVGSTCWMLGKARGGRFGKAGSQRIWVADNALLPELYSWVMVVASPSKMMLFWWIRG
eukprot:Skav212684  [mRNA]  locus=scaffold1930:86587:94180:+ [translate_table: standard]